MRWRFWKRGQPVLSKGEQATLARLWAARYYAALAEAMIYSNMVDRATRKRVEAMGNAALYQDERNAALDELDALKQKLTLLEFKRVSFTDRYKLAQHARDWCVKAGIPPLPFNIVTALSQEGMLK